jgi:hypothetical protein
MTVRKARYGTLYFSPWDARRRAARTRCLCGTYYIHVHPLAKAARLGYTGSPADGGLQHFV